MRALFPEETLIVQVSHKRFTCISTFTTPYLFLQTERETIEQSTYQWQMMIPNLYQKCLYSCRDDFVENLVKTTVQEWKRYASSWPLTPSPPPPPIPRLNMQPFCSFLLRGGWKPDSLKQLEFHPNPSPPHPQPGKARKVKRGVYNKVISDTWCNIKFSSCFTSKHKVIWKNNLAAVNHRSRRALILCCSTKHQIK